MSFFASIPTALVFGNGALDEIGKLTLPGKKALVVTSGTSVKKFGYLNRLLAQLKLANIEFEIFDKVLPNPITDHVEEGAKIAKKSKCDFIIGIGGGSAIDSAKAIAISAVNSGAYWDYVIGGSGKGEEIKVTPLPVVAVSTTAGTGTEVDPFMVITNGSEKIGFGTPNSYPCYAIVDPALTLTIPPDLTAYQGFDALFHSIEGYLNKKSNILSNLYAGRAIKLVSRNLAKAVKDGSDITVRENLSFANILSGYNESTAGCISCHALEHALSAFAPNLPHGAGLIMIAKEYYNYLIEDGEVNDKIIALARLIGNKNATKPNDFIAELDKLMYACNVGSLKMSDYGIKKEDLKEITDILFATMKDLSARDPVEITPKAAFRIYERSYK